MSDGNHMVLGLEGELKIVTKRIRLAMIGCGSHTYRNVLPVLRFIPEAELVACCDLNLQKAMAFASTFGAQQSFADYREMLTKTHIDGLLVVLGFDEHGRPRYPEVVSDLLSRGLPVWLEKPPGATESDVVAMQSACIPPGFAQVGFKKMFMPATEHAGKLLALAEFGDISSYTYRYSVDLPSRPGELIDPDARRFLDDFVHVASMIVRLIGRPSAITAHKSRNGDGILVVEHPDRLIGTVHLSANASGLEAVEEMMVVGEGTDLRIHNGVEVEYFPGGWRGPYGRSTSYFPAELSGVIPDVAVGPRRWVPELSLGTLSSGRHFMQGYYGELREFVDSVLHSRPPRCGGLDDARAVMAMVDAVRLPSGSRHELTNSGTSTPGGKRERPVHIGPPPPACDRTGKPFLMKDGWNYVCSECGSTRTSHENLEFTCAYQ